MALGCARQCPGCAWRWNQALYRLPATHWAHHAITNDDGIGHYKGNFGNLLFIWDIIFGTAHITRRVPPRVGLIDDQLSGVERWHHQMFFPLVQSQRASTALKFGGEVYQAPAPNAQRASD